jgi:hypothetical protein
MLTGKRFRLRASCFGVEMNGELRRATWIPADEILVVSNTSLSAKMLEVVWNEKTLAVFVQDIKARGQEIEYSSAALGIAS